MPSVFSRASFNNSVSCGYLIFDGAQVASTIIAYIIGEGMIDAASAGATVNITAGQQATTPPVAPVVGTVDPAAPEGTPTGAEQAAAVKQNTAMSGQDQG